MSRRVVLVGAWLGAAGAATSAGLLVVSAALGVPVLGSAESWARAEAAVLSLLGDDSRATDVAAVRGEAGDGTGGGPGDGQPGVTAPGGAAAVVAGAPVPGMPGGPVAGPPA
ncbi:MAG: hypothetical protein M3P95_08105, partial [Actinomycetota bacterium]|nr:hypothetical protein [Actinomycetota bacterium]